MSASSSVMRAAGAEARRIPPQPSPMYLLKSVRHTPGRGLAVRTVRIKAADDAQAVAHVQAAPADAVIEGATSVTLATRDGRLVWEQAAPASQL